MSVSNGIKNKISFSYRSESSNRSLGQCQVRHCRFLSCLALSWFLWRHLARLLVPWDLKFILILIRYCSVPPVSVFNFQRLSLEMVEIFQMELWLTVKDCNFRQMFNEWDESLPQVCIFQNLWQNVSEWSWFW